MLGSYKRRPFDAIRRELTTAFGNVHTTALDRLGESLKLLRIVAATQQFCRDNGIGISYQNQIAKIVIDPKDHLRFDAELTALTGAFLKR